MVLSLCYYPAGMQVITYLTFGFTFEYILPYAYSALGNLSNYLVTGFSRFFLFLSYSCEQDCSLKPEVLVKAKYKEKLQEASNFTFVI